mgnify:CR=1 FL=1
MTRSAIGLHALVLLLPLVLVFRASAQDPEGRAIPDTELKTTADLLRGYNDAELDEAQRSIPERPEIPLREAIPRIVTVRGMVYRDGNANGKHDGGDAGMAGVLLTDGQRVMRSPPSGVFELVLRIDSEPHDRFVVVTRPSGYRPTSPYYLRIPYDVQQTEYQVDFGFSPEPASALRDFWFIAISDSQFTSHAQMIPTAKDYAQITSAPGKPAFMVTAGDLTMNGSQFEWDMYDRIRRSSRIPVYEGFGGHDGNCLDPRCTVSFERRIGPPYYSWNYGGVHFFQLVVEMGYLRTPAQVRQREWLAADLGALPKGTPVIAVAHYPLDPAWFDQRKEEGINVICQIGAHWHVVQAGSRQQVPVLNSAPARGNDWGAYSRTYRWVHVKPDGVRTQLRVAGQYKRLRVVAPGPEATLGDQPLVVLAYDSALLVKKVECRWTDPAGKLSTTVLQARGDWTWHGVFSPGTPGLWECELVATDVAGGRWVHGQQVEVGSQPVAAARPGEDLPWIMAGSTPRRTGQGPTAPLFPLWVRNTGSIHVLHSSPVVVDGRVYIGVGNPNAGTPGAGVLCLDASSGETLWKADSPLGDIRGTVSVHNGVVYASTGEGWVVAYEAEAGTLLWSRPLHSSYQQGRPLGIINTPPVPTADGLLVANVLRPQQLLDFDSGQEKATLPADVGSYSSFAAIDGGIMYCVRRGKATAMTFPGGEVKWELEETSRSTSPPVVVGGKLLYSSSGYMTARDAATGEILWRVGHAHAGYQNAIPAVWDNQVLVNGTNFRSLDLETGKENWLVPCGQEMDRFVRSRRQAIGGSSSPIIAGDLAFFGHDDTSVRAVNSNGKVVWEHRLGTPIKTAPLVTGNLLLVHDFAGNLWCFSGGK